MNKFLSGLGLIILTVQFSIAQSTIKLMSYNLLHYPTGTNIDRKDDLRYVLNAYQPDILMACEIENPTGANEVLNYCLGTQNYEATYFTYNHSGSHYHLQQMMYFNKHKFELVSEAYLVTNVRDINHYTLKLRTADATNQIYIDVYVAHLKAGANAANSGNNNTSDEDSRRDMVQIFVDDLQNIPSDHFVIFAGDFNLYGSNEPAYQKILDPNNDIVMKDPINRSGNWHNNYNFKDIDTQSTHSLSQNSYVGGGLDDRFDFIMMSENLINSPVLHYVSGTYSSYGNNGTCFNKAINSTYCAGSTYDATMRNHLYITSDHLPVVASLETPVALGINDIDLPSFTINEGSLIHQTMSIHTNNQLIILQIYNSLGQKIQHIENYRSDQIINTSFLSNGLYYLKIQSGQTQQTIKFVKAD